MQTSDDSLSATICLCAAIDDLGRSVCDKLGDNLQVSIGYSVKLNKLYFRGQDKKVNNTNKGCILASRAGISFQI